MSGKILVSYPIAETDDERKERVKAGKPLPHYSFMVSNVSELEEDDDRTRGENEVVPDDSAE